MDVFSNASRQAETAWGGGGTKRRCEPMATWPQRKLPGSFWWQQTPSMSRPCNSRISRRLIGRSRPVAGGMARRSSSSSRKRLTSSLSMEALCGSSSKKSNFLGVA